MNRPVLPASLLLAATMLAAGCGSTASRAAAPASPAAPPSLATSLATATGTWAVAVMGGSAASHNNFWQLFVRPAGTSTWRLATPPGVASNGGLVLTGLASGSVLAGFRPSQDLAYSPLAATKDDGKTWSPALLDAGLADVPGALAADPASGRLLALLTTGTTEMSGPGGTAWTRLVTRRALAASAAGTRCQLGSVTADAFSPSGQPLLAAGCGRPGTAGIFSHTGRTWQLSRARATRRLRAPGHHRAPAHHHRRHHQRPARRRNQVSSTPAGRLVCRRRRALDTVITAAAERRHADIRILWAGHQPGDHPEPPPRSGHHERRGLPGGSCRHCPQAPRRSRRAHQADGTPWPSTAPSSPSGRLHRRPGLGQRPDHQGSRPIRIIRLTPRQCHTWSGGSSSVATPADDPTPPSCLRAPTCPGRSAIPAKRTQA